MNQSELISAIAESADLTKADADCNPRTGESIQIKVSKSPAFKAGKALKDAVN